MPRFLQLVVIGIACVALSPGVAGDATTNATCITANWTLNQEQESPCLVASALQAVCNAGTWSVTALPSGGAYGGPKMGQSSRCQCSTVVYSLLAACGVCQSQIFDSWTDWKTNCISGDISISSFPLPIPNTVTVPSWAYLDVNTTGVWDEAASFTVHNSGAQDSSAITPTSTSSTASTTSAFGSTTSAAASASTTSTNPSPTSSNKSSNTGAIAGGVAGGIVLVLLGIGGYMIHRRKSRAKYEPTTKSTNREKVDLIGRSPPTSPVSTFNVQPPLKYYNPDDPSTFPPTPSPSFFPPVTSPTTSSIVSPMTASHSQAASQSMTSPGAPSFVGSQLSEAGPERPRVPEL